MYYASLVKSLIGLYYPIIAESEYEARAKIATSSLSGLWCSIYNKAQAETMVAAYGGIILPDSYASHLDFNCHEVWEAMQ